MVFRIFEKGSHINEGIPNDVISIGKSTISFGKEARAFLTQSFAEIYLNREDRLVGIKPTENGLKGFKISSKESSPYTYMASGSFLKLIPMGRYKFYIEDGMLIFKVSEIAKRKQDE